MGSNSSLPTGLETLNGPSQTHGAPSKDRNKRIAPAVAFDHPLYFNKWFAGHAITVERKSAQRFERFLKSWQARERGARERTPSPAKRDMAPASGLAAQKPLPQFNPFAAMGQQTKSPFLVATRKHVGCNQLPQSGFSFAKKGGNGASVPKVALPKRPSVPRFSASFIPLPPHGSKPEEPAKQARQAESEHGSKHEEPAKESLQAEPDPRAPVSPPSSTSEPREEGEIVDDDSVVEIEPPKQHKQPAAPLGSQSNPFVVRDDPTQLKQPVPPRGSQSNPLVVRDGPEQRKPQPLPFVQDHVQRNPQPGAFLRPQPLVFLPAGPYNIGQYDLILYCDGSFTKRGYGGCGVAYVQDGAWHGIAVALGRVRDSVEAELHAIHSAFRLATRLIRPNHRKLLILTDCRTAMDFIQGAASVGDRSILRDRLSYEIVRQSDRMQKAKTSVAIAWVKGHGACEGNHVADFLAGFGSQEFQQQVDNFPWDDPDRAVLDISDAQLRKMANLAHSKAQSHHRAVQRRAPLPRAPGQRVSVADVWDY